MSNDTDTSSSGSNDSAGSSTAGESPEPITVYMAINSVNVLVVDIPTFVFSF